MPRLLVVLALLALAAPIALADADLLVIMNNPPAGQETPLPAGYSAYLAATILNLGGDVARDVILTVDLPPGVTISQQPVDERCDTTTTPIRCRVGDLTASGPNSTVEFTFAPQMPLREGKHTITVTASSATPDPRPENNRGSATYVTTFNAELHVHAEPGFVRADPGELVRVRFTIDNFQQTISPEDLRLRFDALHGSIEGISAPQGWSCTGGGASAECRAPRLIESCRCSGYLFVDFRVSDDRGGGDSLLTGVASSNLPELYEGNDLATATVARYRWISVTNVNDAGSGSLRAAIEEANGCGTAPCKIAFEIPAPVPAEGWFTIQPSTPLPDIIAERVFVDGATQTKFTGDTNPRGPEIALDGRFTASGDGLRIGSRCEGQVTHLAIGNFREHGLVAVNGSLCVSRNIEPRRIAKNYIGVDPSGMRAWPNLRGLEVLALAPYFIEENVISGNRRSGIWSVQGGLYVRRNRIGTAADGATPLPNGASGIYVGPRVGVAEVVENTISYNAEMGVAIARGADQVEVRQNAMRDNGGLGIDWELDGVSPLRNDEGHEPSNAPLLLSARYDAARERTILTLRLQTGRFGLYEGGALVDVYANDDSDGDGERYLFGSGNYARNTKGEPFEIELPGDHRGMWLNATSTRIYYLFSNPPGDVASHGSFGGITRTSELSNSIYVTP